MNFWNTSGEGYLENKELTKSLLENRNGDCIQLKKDLESKWKSVSAVAPELKIASLYGMQLVTTGDCIEIIFSEPKPNQVAADMDCLYAFILSKYW